MKTSIQAIVAQPTNSDGTLKRSVWTTKLNQLLTDNIINVSINDDVVINDTSIDVAVITAKALQPVADGTETLDNWLSYLSKGYISPQQANTTVNKTAQPLPGHYLTATEYKNNCLKLNATLSTLQQIDTLVNSVASTSTKDNLLQVISAIARLVISDSQNATYDTLLDKEIVFIQVQNNLEAIGCKVTIVNDTTIKVSAAMDSVSKAIEVCNSLAFVQTAADFNAASMTIVLTMVKQAV
jgi:hypothetical protein